MEPKQRVIVALDTIDLATAKALAETLKGSIGGLKIGKEFFTANGPGGVENLNALGLPIFLDLKFHDIPNTVGRAVAAATQLKPKIINVHASGGREMLIAARESAFNTATKMGIQPPIVLGVTVLTSLDDSDLRLVGITHSVSEQVKRLADLSQESQLDGVVCSPLEVELLRTHCGPNFQLLTPGIRPEWAQAGDQKRFVTPSQAVEWGTDFIVIGRPITEAQDPLIAANLVLKELKI
ncbi:MAG: orotidine-5'-phosphate decarboxylase [Pseudomonadota bacterium]|nr:orotidine-5'-phosphate decarboxylase [Pseudomonadota bacterium]